MKSDENVMDDESLASGTHQKIQKYELLDM
jgi:hypothetical protein